MREIKFRAWDGEQMSQGDDLQVLIPNKGNIKAFWDEEYNVELHQRTSNPEIISDPEIMQFTGLKDCNGVEIYEGDVVNWKQAEGGILPASGNTYTCQIKWIRTGWACEDVKPIRDDYHSCFTFSSSHIEIIGNIYQNPELLQHDN